MDYNQDWEPTTESAMTFIHLIWKLEQITFGGGEGKNVCLRTSWKVEI